MKKILLLYLACVFCACHANAQVQKGNVLVGGSFVHILLGPNDPHVFSVNLTAKAAWFVRDNIAFGDYLNLGVQIAAL